MGAARTHFTAGEWAVLALLDEAPAHGFALARAMAAGGEVGGADPAPLLRAQRDQFAAMAQRLTEAADAAEGFERGLLLWRRYNTAAAVQFTEAMLSERTLTEP